MDLGFFPVSFTTFIGQGACPIPLFADRATAVSAICCTGLACPGNTIPTVCSFDCARAFTTFLADCHDVLAPIIGPDELRKYVAFGNLCTNLDVRSLVSAIHSSHCWYCGDRNVDADEECDAGDTTDECASSPCQNGGVCFDGQGGYTCQCVEGFYGSDCEQTVLRALICHDDEKADCDGHASCTHTGPGTHDCVCLFGYSGDGHTNSCIQQGATRCLADCTLEVHCPPLPQLTGATIALSNGNIAPSIATYTCDASGNPPVDGHATRTCQADGTWTGVAPTACATQCAFHLTDGPCTATGTVDGGSQCISRGYYTNSEACHFETTRAGTVTVKSFNTEASCDMIDITDSMFDGTYSGGPGNNQQGGLQPVDGEELRFEVTEVSTFYWHTDGSVLRAGWELCCDPA